jgi:hypothetical protein
MGKTPHGIRAFQVYILGHENKLQGEIPEIWQVHDEIACDNCSPCAGRL